MSVSFTTSDLWRSLFPILYFLFFFLSFIILIFYQHPRFAFPCFSSSFFCSSRHLFPLSDCCCFIHFHF
jgi:hypothetical protein